MGAVIPAILAHGNAGFTPLDHDAELLVAASSSDPDHSMIRKTQCGAAMALLRRWDLGLLDPDAEAHVRELPKNWWLAESNTLPVPEGAQLHFPAILAGIRETLGIRIERPWIAYEAHQETSVPKDEILLNLWYYLSAEGSVVSPKVIRQDNGFLVQLIVS